MPELLFVTTYAPGRSELGGAAFVDRHLLRALDAVADVRVFPMVGGDGPPVPLQIRHSPAALAATALRMALWGEAYQEAKFRWAPSWSRRLDELATAARDVPVVVTSQWPALLAADLLDLPVHAHVAHNVDTVIARTYDPLPLRLLGNSRRMARRELALLDRPDVVFTLSSRDAERITRSRRPASALRLLDKPGPRASRGRVGTIGLVGSAGWPPNAEAIEVLVERVLPALRGRDGRPIRLLLAGNGTERWAGRPGVEALGTIDDIDAFYERVDLVVVARLGTTTGVSVKLLEAVERGIPVVCPGALARDAGLGAGVIAADTVEDMIAAVRRFVREPAELPKRWETPATVGLQEFAAAVAPRTEAAA